MMYEKYSSLSGRFSAIVAVVTLMALMRFEMGALAVSAQNNNTTAKTDSTTSNNNNPAINECNLMEASALEKDLLQKVNKLKGHTFEWEDKDHKYYFSVCSKAPYGVNNADGFVQVNKEKNNTFVLGRLNDVDLEGFDNIMRLTYNSGDNYNQACKKNARSAVVYFICDPNMKEDTFVMIEENNERDKSSGCGYIFKLATSKTCDSPVPNSSTTQSSSSPSSTSSSSSSSSSSSTSTANSRTSSASSSASSTSTTLNKISKKLGFFPVILIIMSCLIVSYFVMGAFYMRFVKRARGWEQIPNYPMWQAMGHRIGDCCANTCRLGGRTTQVHSYENINDRISDDENLLN